jgi:hypothetical protein
MAEYELYDVDLGLSNEEAKRGLRAAAGYAMKVEPVDLDNGPILRGDMLKIEGLYRALITKGAITEEEYDEAMRLTYNNELARLEEEYSQEFR